MTSREITHKVEEWAKENYPDTMYEAHEIAIAKYAYQAGLISQN